VEERFLHTEEATGSIPVSPTMKIHLSWTNFCPSLSLLAALSSRRVAFLVVHVSSRLDHNLAG